MWFLSGVDEMPTPNVCSDAWNHVESSTILMLLACRLKIIPTSNLKLIISFLVLLILVLVVSRLVMWRTKVLMYHTMVLLVRLTKVRR